MEFPSYVDLVKGASAPSFNRQKMKQNPKTPAQTRLNATSLTTERSARNNGTPKTLYHKHLSTASPSSRQRTNLFHHDILLDHKQLKRFFEVRKQYTSHLDAMVLVLQHVQQQYEHSQSYVHSLKAELDRQKLTMSLLQNHNQELELINDTANRKIERLKLKLSEQKNYFLTKLKGKELHTSFEEVPSSPSYSKPTKSTPSPDMKQKIRIELHQIEEEEKKWKATIEAQLRKFEEHEERTNILQQQFELYQKTEEWIRAKNNRENQSWKLRMEQLQQQERSLYKMQQELEKQKASFEEDLWKQHQQLVLEHEQERARFQEEKEKWREAQKKEDMHRRSLLEDLKAQKQLLQEEEERIRQYQCMLEQREEDKNFQEKFQTEKFQQQMELVRLKETKLKQEQEQFFKMQKQELLKLDSLRAQQEELLKSEREAMLFQMMPMPQVKSHEACLRSQFDLETQAMTRSLQNQFAREKEQLVKQHQSEMDLQQQIVQCYQQQADKECKTYVQMKGQLEKWKVEYENNIKCQLEEEYKTKMARIQLVAKLEAGSPLQQHINITPPKNKPSLSEAIQKLKKQIKEEQIDPALAHSDPSPPVESTSPEKPDTPTKLPGSPLNPRAKQSPSMKSRSFHSPQTLLRTKTFQMLIRDSRDSNDFPEYAKCPKCQRSFEIRKNLLFSMCSCGYVHQPQEEGTKSSLQPNSKFKVMRTPSKASLVRTSSFDTLPISTNQIEKVSPRMERSSSFHLEAPAPPPLPPLQENDNTVIRNTPRTRIRKDSKGMNLIDEIKQLNVDVEKRLTAIAEAAAKKVERKETDAMSSLFGQIKRIIPDSARRLETMEATEKARQQVLEEKKKILDTQLQNKKQTLKSKAGGIEQLEEQRRQKDAELFAKYFSEQVYFEDEEEFDVVGTEGEEFDESEEDEQDLSSLVSSFMSPIESRKSKSQPFNIPQLKLPLRDSVDVQMIEVDQVEEEEEEEDLSSLVSALVRN